MKRKRISDRILLFLLMDLLAMTALVLGIPLLLGIVRLGPWTCLEEVGS
jgi:hypothetical protein